MDGYFVLSRSVQYCSVEGLATVAQLRLSTACPASTKEPLWVNDHVRRISRACRRAESKWKASKLQSNISDLEVLGVSQHFKTRKWKYFSHVIAALLSRIINCFAFCPSYFPYFSSRSLLLKNAWHFGVFHKVSSTGAHIWPSTLALPQNKLH